MGKYEEIRNVVMENTWFDQSMENSEFFTLFFPGLLTGKDTLDTYFKGLTRAALEKALQELKQAEQHCLLEVYREIEKDKEVDEKLRLSILSTVRTNLSKELIAAYEDEQRGHSQDVDFHLSGSEKPL